MTRLAIHEPRGCPLQPFSHVSCAVPKREQMPIAGQSSSRSGNEGPGILENGSNISIPSNRGNHLDRKGEFMTTSEKIKLVEMAMQLCTLSEHSTYGKPYANIEAAFKDLVKLACYEEDQASDSSAS